MERGLEPISPDSQTVQLTDLDPGSQVWDIVMPAIKKFQVGSSHRALQVLGHQRT